MMDQSQKDWWNNVAHGDLVTLDESTKLVRIEFGQDDHGDAAKKGIEYLHHDAFEMCW